MLRQTHQKIMQRHKFETQNPALGLAISISPGSNPRLVLVATSSHATPPEVQNFAATSHATPQSLKILRPPATPRHATEAQNFAATGHATGGKPPPVAGSTLNIFC